MSNPIFSYWYRLSSQMTLPEKALEPAVAELGEPYRAQHLFLGLKHIADFALLRRRIIIEVDGDSHRVPAQMKKDLEHMAALQDLGWVVVRISNEEAERDPYLAVAGALKTAAHLRESPPDYRQALAQHLLDYPGLPASGARSPRRKPRSRVEKAPRVGKPRAPQTKNSYRRRPAPVPLPE